MTLDMISQVFLFIFGVFAIVLLARDNRWGFVFGLLSNPFYYITAYLNDQWGLFLVNIAYTFSWAYGCYTHFYQKKHKYK
ncbi:MAG TPA: nicotinamide mononucleotide transporter [Candidatus Nanoarchaeia archaeon]|nr:nicotinamide mononucleotide transporter [Candidatus Nanoarchaeia archaeon]